jgi:hypothetical protein
MSDISQEAKAALANVARQMATDRLRRDGAYLMNAVRRRVRAFAQERNLPPADFAKLMHKRMSTKAFMAFCKAHKVSADWLLCGDLKGLQRMTKEAKAEPAPDQAPYRDLLAAFGKLDRVGRKAVVNYLQTQVDVDPRDDGERA